MRIKIRVSTILFILFTATLVYSQDWRYYNNENLFKGNAVVFKETYTPPILLPSNIERFSPSDDEIVLAESILLERYNIDFEWSNKIKNVKKKYWKYNRQYLGYIDSQGNKKIIISLMNFKRKKEALKKFEGWEKTFVVGFGSYYETNLRIFVADLSLHKLSSLGQ